MKKIHLLFIALCCTVATLHAQVVQELNTRSAVKTMVVKDGLAIPQVTALPANPALLNYNANAANGSPVWCSCTADTTKRGLYIWMGNRWQNITRVITTAYNGLSVVNDTLQLGGTVAKNTTLLLANDSVAFAVARNGSNTAQQIGDYFIAEKNAIGNPTWTLLNTGTTPVDNGEFFTMPGRNKIHTDPIDGTELEWYYQDTLDSGDEQWSKINVNRNEVSMTHKLSNRYNIEALDSAFIKVGISGLQLKGNSWQYPTTKPANTKYLVASPNGTLSFIDNTTADSNIYKTNGSLQSDRIINGNRKNLYFGTGVDSFGAIKDFRVYANDGFQIGDYKNNNRLSTTSIPNQLLLQGGKGLTLSWQDSLSSTLLTSPTNNRIKVIVQDTLTGRWYSSAMPTPLDTTSLSNRINTKLNISDTLTMLGGYVRGSFTAGQLPFANGTRSVAGSANLFWDNANGRLGVGTSAPNALLHVNGNSSLAGTSIITTVQTSTITAGGNNLSVTGNTQSYNLQGISAGAFNVIVSNNYTGTANHSWFNLTGSGFAPTSGSGNYAAMGIIPSVNQTGTATGQTRGLYIFANITATTVNAFRALEIANIRANDYGIYQVGVGTRNYFQGSIGIGTSTPNTAAALDISSSDKGILIPRLTSVQAAAITPTNGLMYYNTDSLRFMIRTGAAWRGVRFTDEGGGGASLPAGNNLDILRNRGGTWVAEPDSLTMNGLVNITGSRLLEYSGGWRTALLNDSSILSKKHIDSLLAAGNGLKVLYSSSNSTPVNVFVQSITNNTAGQIEVSVTVTSGAGAIKIIRRSFGFKKIAGTLTLITPSDLITPYADSGMSSADINLVNSSNNAGVQVTGIGSSLDWSIEIKFVSTVNIPV